MQKSLQQLAMRLEELDRSLMDPAVAGDGKKCVWSPKKALGWCTTLAGT